MSHGPSRGPSRARATAIGFGAVLLWAALAVVTVAVGEVPPYQLTAAGFAIVLPC